MERCVTIPPPDHLNSAHNLFLQVVKVYSEDGTCRSLEVTAGTTAHHVCEMLVQKTHALHDDCWSLVEVYQHLALERYLEDHESVVEVQATWPVGGDSRFVFRKNYAKYELFKSSPQSFFPEVMVSSCEDAANKGMSHSELIQVFTSLLSPLHSDLLHF
ncbi:hypothetical protein JD844_002158 [Phrynosoma platyrhinos]|uniref:Ras-associating domain-containing protein n=1 Tax=Phrynosoma platyrhinos TaxID=52577 RepID=A0ABQ7TBQ6_PHRPL|nr:hypothetical protein JD844_002158 [Phrynosoma platyrhinos]